jgi:LmbE family N-acetylglucosaminyl deacetylase
MPATRNIKRPSIPEGRRVAVFAAHGDDEVLGCGGTIRRHAMDGDEVSIVIFADGETSRGGRNSKAAVAKREAAAREAANILGVGNVFIHQLPDNRLDTMPLLDLAKLAEKYIEEQRPHTVYTHHAGDLNVDHRRVHEAVVTACRPQGDCPVRRLLFFEVPSSTEWRAPSAAAAFTPNWFVDISGELERKIDALKIYGAEMRPWPHPRSYEGVTHLARWRGATVGCEAAEAFMLGREIRLAD